jgi:hypothetical protein
VTDALAFAIPSPLPVPGGLQFGNQAGLLELCNGAEHLADQNRGRGVLKEKVGGGRSVSGAGSWTSLLEPALTGALPMISPGFTLADFEWDYRSDDEHALAVVGAGRCSRRMRLYTIFGLNRRKSERFADGVSVQQHLCDSARDQACR